MAIEFTCGNPDCRQPVRAPDDAAGRRARCPFCGHVQRVPETLGLADEATPPAAPPPAPPPAPGAAKGAPRPGADGMIACPDCGRRFAADVSLCPQCGWVNSTLFGPPPTAAAPPGGPRPPIRPPVQAAGRDAGRLGRLAADCGSAVVYGVSNQGSIFKLVLYAAVLAFVLFLGFYFLGALLLWTFAGRIALGVLLLCVEVVIGGFYFRFFLDAAIGSMEGADQAPDVPPFDIKELWIIGLRLLGVLVLYVLPIVTLPLLPLGLLAMSYTDDERAFDLRWALKAAAKRPGALAVLWLFLLLWEVVLVAAVVLTVMLIALVTGALAAFGGCFGMLIAFALNIFANLIIAAAACVFITVQFRCIGMLGRHYPELTDSLPEERSPGVAGAFIAGGVASALVVWLLLVPAALGGWPSLGSAPEEQEDRWGSSGWMREQRRPGAPEGKKLAAPRVDDDAVAPMKYLHLTLRARGMAAELKAIMAMATIATAIQQYRMQNDAMPATLDDLVQARILDERALQSPVRGAGRYTYIPGQDASMDRRNVLVYDAKAIYPNGCCILRLGGRAETIPAQQLDEEIEQTHKRIAAARAATRPGPRSSGRSSGRRGE
jgi:hypothetical protein